MPYRDPETGQFVSDDGTHDVCYRDHVTVTFAAEAENTGGNNESGWTEFEIDLPELGNDELAELAYLSAGLSVRNDPEAGTGNTSPGSINAVAEMGANLEGSDYIVGDGDGRENLTVDTEVDMMNAINTSSGAEDEQGHFGILSAAADAAYQDSSGGTGGGGGSSTDRFEKNFRQIYGEGPWLDATDQFNARLWVNKNTTASDARGHVVGQAVYYVVEDEHCRPSFGLR